MKIQSEIRKISAHRIIFNSTQETNEVSFNYWQIKKCSTGKISIRQWINNSLFRLTLRRICNHISVDFSHLSNYSSRFSPGDYKTWLIFPEVAFKVQESCEIGKFNSTPSFLFGTDNVCATRNQGMNVALLRVQFESILSYAKEKFHYSIMSNGN